MWHIVEIPWGIIAHESFRTKKLENLKYTHVLRFRQGSVNKDWDSFSENYKYLLEHCDSEKLITLDVDGILCDEGIITTRRLLHKLQEISLEYCDNISGAGWICLSSFPELKSLFINFCIISNKSIEKIMKVENLKELEFARRRNITEDTLKLLQIPKNLDILIISDGNVMFEYKHLGDDLHLKELGLHDMKINNETFTDIALLTNLKRLFITSTGNTAINLSFISNLILLEELELTNFVTISGFSYLPKLVKLKRLDLSGSDSFAEVQLSHTYTLGSLTHLFLQECKWLTDDILSHISSLQRLKLLNISYCEYVTDTGVYQISKLESLEELILDGCYEITDVAHLHISNITLLNRLSLHRCSSATDTALQHLSKLRFLQKLGIQRLDCITDEGLSYLQISSLQNLNIKKCEKVTDQGLSYISTMTSLLELNIGSCLKITDIGLLHISKLTSLRNLNISWTMVTDVGLSYLCIGLRLLKNLVLDYCLNVSNSGVSKLSHLPFIKDIWLFYCPNVNTEELDCPWIHFHNVYPA